MEPSSPHLWQPIQKPKPKTPFWRTKNFIIGAAVLIGLFLIFSTFGNRGGASGSFTEGILGTPRFANPVLAGTRADQDVVALVYSGLLKISDSGELVPDVAESITLSDDGLTYNIVLRQDVAFHDGAQLTAKDVVYTIQLVQEPDLKSPLRGNWTNVQVQEVSEFELNVIIEEAYVPFIENFTLGILPAHLWSDLPIEQIAFSQLNTQPIGSGPYSIAGVRRSPTLLVERYELVAQQDQYNAPQIKDFILEFYAEEQDIVAAFEEGLIDATAYMPNELIASQLQDGVQLIEEPLPRSFGVFFNQNRSTILRDDSARHALSIVLNREDIIENTLYGFGVPILGPTIAGDNDLQSEDNNATSSSSLVEQAKVILKAGDWEQNEQGIWEKEIDDSTLSLRITVRASNLPVFDAVLTELTAAWQTLGVEVQTEQFEPTGLIQSVIRPRDFEALLFGVDMNRANDLFPFWHSSQKDDPGLNIAQYTNLTVDELLEQARAEQDGAERIANQQEASEVIADERPAVFIFQPTMTYLVRSGTDIVPITQPGRISDRFSTVSNWNHAEDDWSIF